MKTKRQLQKEHTKDRILKAAYNVYAEDGFTAPTTAIAKAAAVSHGTIFAHFPSVDLLLIELLREFGSQLGEELHALTESNGTVADWLTLHLDILSKYEPFYTHLINEKHLLPEDARTAFFSIQTVAAHHFSHIINREIQSGNVKDLPSYTLFNIWIGFVHYYLQNKELFSPNAPLLSHCREILTATYLILISQN